MRRAASTALTQVSSFSVMTPRPIAGMCAPFAVMVCIAFATLVCSSRSGKLATDARRRNPLGLLVQPQALDHVADLPAVEDVADVRQLDDENASAVLPQRPLDPRLHVVK